MKAKLHLLLFILSACEIHRRVHGASLTLPSQQPSTFEGLQINVIPGVITPSVTDSMMLNCTMDMTKQSSAVSLVSLVIMKLVRSTYEESVFLNGYKPHQVVIIKDLGSKVNGFLDPTNVSYISMEWTYPTEDLAGMYVCEANTIDSRGHNLKLTVGEDIQVKTINMSSLVESLRDLKERFGILTQIHEDGMAKQEKIIREQNTRLDNLTQIYNNEMAKQEKIIREQNTRLDNLTQFHKNEMAKQEKIISEQNTRLDNLTQFHKSEKAKQEKIIEELKQTLNETIQKQSHQLYHNTNVVIDGWTLYASYTYTGSFIYSQETCRRIGGRLLEVPQAKLMAVKDRLMAEGLGALSYRIGVNRNAQQQWVFNSTGASAGAISWDSSPSSAHGCAYFNPGFSGYRSVDCSGIIFSICGVK